MRVYSTKTDRHFGVRIRYRRCNKCGRNGDSPEVLPLRLAPIQLNRLSANHHPVSAH